MSQGRVGQGSGAAHVSPKGDAQAAVGPLVRPNDQHLLALCCSVPACPVEVVKSLVELARNRRQCGDPVIFACAPRGQC